MAIRLSGAQVTRIDEALTRFHENSRQSLYRQGPNVPHQTATEELVEDILKVVLPEVEIGVNRR
jgi:hypothetical protein